MPTWGIIASLTGAIGSLIGGIGTAVYTGLLVPAKIVDRITAEQQKNADLWKQVAETERTRADVQQGDLRALMRELTEALRRSRPAGDQ